jgi:hypothetical protein
MTPEPRKLDEPRQRNDLRHLPYFGLIEGHPLANNLKRPWTADDDKRLIEFRASGRSNISIGVALRRSASAVKGRLATLAKKPDSHDQRQRDE